MPHFWNNILVVTQEELIPTWWKSYNALKHELWRYKNKPYGIKRAQLGGNGRKFLIKFDSLPNYIQEELGDPRILDHPLEMFYQIDKEAVEFYSEFKRPNYGYLKMEEQNRYIINASVLTAVVKLEEARIQMRLSKKGSLKATKDVKSVHESIWHDTITFNKVLKAKSGEEHTLPSNYRVFRDKLNEFKKHKYICLIKDPKGKKIGNATKKDARHKKLLNDLFGTQKHKPTATQIHRQYESFLSGYIDIINNATGEVYNPSEYKTLGISSITAYLRTWDSQISTLTKRSGNRQVLMQKFNPHHSLKQPTFAGSIISIDDRQPPFLYEKGKRMWFYNGIDLASECFTVFVYGKTKEGIILDFYRQMVRNYHAWGFNLPDGIECESSLNSSFKDTILREGVMFQNVRIEANNARGKRIERYFGSLRYENEKQREGWIARPFAKKESNQAGNSPDVIIPYNQLAQQSMQELIDWNNQPHSKHPEMTRFEYFQKNQHPDLKPTNYKLILPVLGFTTKTSCNAGIVKLQNAEWLLGINGKISTGEQLVDLMKDVEGQTLEVKWLDDHQGRVFIAYVYMDDRFICELHPKPIYSRAKIEMTPEDEEARSLMSAYANTISAYQRLQKNQLDDVTIINTTPKEPVKNAFYIPGADFTTPQTFQAKEITEVITMKDYSDEDEFGNIDLSQHNQSGNSWKDTFLNR